MISAGIIAYLRFTTASIVMLSPMSTPAQICAKRFMFMGIYAVWVVTFCRPTNSMENINGPAGIPTMLPRIPPAVATQNCEKNVFPGVLWCLVS